MKVNLKNPNEFKKTLIKKGYSQSKFARAVNLSSPYVNQIVNGERFPSGEVANRIAECLNLEFDDIFFINDTSKS
jgi:transcriptional regulator with XRE-family HTH domain